MSKINWNDPNPLFINPKFGIDLHGNAPKGIPLPTYGNYGGPNISDKLGTGETVDALDDLFKTHDETIEDAILNPEDDTPGVLTPDELVAAHAELFGGIKGLPESDGLILDDAEATLYAGFTIFGLTAQLVQLGLLNALEAALDPTNPDDVSAALNDAQGYMETGLAELTTGEARSLQSLLPLFEDQFEDFLIA
jgi:hypothetical protein